MAVTTIEYQTDQGCWQVHCRQCGEKATARYRPEAERLATDHDYRYHDQPNAPDYRPAPALRALSYYERRISTAAVTSSTTRTPPRPWRGYGGN